MSFSWSGGNSLTDRLQARDDLLVRIMELQDTFPKAALFLVAHSHGGNVAAYALHHLPKTHRVVGLACLATPFVHAKVRAEGPSKESMRDALRDNIWPCIGAGLFVPRR